MAVLGLVLICAIAGIAIGLTIGWECGFNECHKAVMNALDKIKKDKEL